MNRGTSEVRTFLRSAGRFVVIGCVLYGVAAIAAERVAEGQANRNRFHRVHAASVEVYDHVVLGASHAAVFDYRDMNDRLEDATGGRILNLATVGGGVTLNRLLLDYFLVRHETRSVVYVLDSFVFHSRQWNEDRVLDRSMFARAPWDPALIGLMLRSSAARPMLLDYALGFSKINDLDRFEPDVFENEGARFERRYRPIPQLDRQRIAYLYPDGEATPPLTESPYLGEFEALLSDVRARGIRFLVVLPPLPNRIREMIPGESRFVEVVDSIAELHGAELHDFSEVADDEAHFYDSDHLNRDGVLQLFENHLAPVLSGGRR